MGLVMKEAGLTTREMVMAYIVTPTEILSKETGTSISDMDMVCTLTQQQERVTGECGKLEARKALEILLTPTISFQVSTAKLEYTLTKLRSAIYHRDVPLSRGYRH